MRNIFILGILAAGALSSAANAQSYCREFNRDIVVGGRMQNGYGTACMQPDGAWQVQNQGQAVEQVSYQTVGQVRYVDPYYGAPYYGQPVYVPTYPAYAPPPVIVQPRPAISFNFGYTDWDHGYRGHKHGHGRGWNNHWRGGHGHGHGRGGHGRNYGWR